MYSKELLVRARLSASVGSVYRPLYAKTYYGAWVPDAERAAFDGKEGMSVFGSYADEYDRHRPHYPSALWDRALDLAGGSPTNLAAVDIAAGTGRGALELARRGLTVTGLDLDAGMLEALSADAVARGLGARLNTQHAPAEATGLADDSCDLVAALQSFHWFDAEKALQEFHRILKPSTSSAPGPLLVLAWNDRDLSVDWMQEFESLVEKYNPKYDRALKQTEAVVNGGEVLTASGLFELACEPLVLPNPTPRCTLEALLSLNRTFSYIRNALTAEDLSALERDMANLVSATHGDGAEFDFPWVTKAYMLRPKASA